MAAEFEVPLGATFATIQTKLSQFPTRVARYFVGLRDAAEIEERLRDKIDADLSDLQGGSFTAASAIADAVAAGPSMRRVNVCSPSSLSTARIALRCCSSSRPWQRRRAV